MNLVWYYRLQTDPEDLNAAEYITAFINETSVSNQPLYVRHRCILLYAIHTFMTNMNNDVNDTIISE
jgi:hypothetical protein